MIDSELIPVGEIDSYGRFHIDSLFYHRDNAEKYAKVLLARGAFRVSVGGVIVGLSRLARDIDIRALKLSS